MELGLEAQQTLILNDLRSRVVLECDGQLKQVVMSLLQHYLSREEFGCYRTSSSVRLYYDESMSFKHMPSWYCYSRSGVEKEFQRNSRTHHFMYFIAEELREIMAQLGFRTLKEMVGQSQKLNVNKAIKQSKRFRFVYYFIQTKKAKNGTESQYNNTRSRIRERFRFPDYKGGDSFYL
jgi:glutamate synthase (ferredoxin)